MAQILPPIMPVEMQAAALSEFDHFYDPDFFGVTPEIDRAKQWFEDIVTKHSELSITNKDLSYVKCEKNGNKYLNNDNTDIHTDLPDHVSRIKYLLTLCNIDQAGTMYFPELGRKQEDKHQHIRNFFCRQDGLLVPRDNPPFLLGEVTQAQNGQVSMFDTKYDVHTAAPLSRGARKLLFVVQYNQYR